MNLWCDLREWGNRTEHIGDVSNCNDLRAQLQ